MKVRTRDSVLNSNLVTSVEKSVYEPNKMVVISDINNPDYLKSSPIMRKEISSVFKHAYSYTTSL